MNRFRIKPWIFRSFKHWILSTLFIASLSLTGFAGEPEQVLLPLNSVQNVRQTWTTNVPRTLELITGAGNSLNGNGAVKFGGVAKDAPGNQYFGIMIPLPSPINLEQRRLVFDMRCDTPDTLKFFYVRCYNRSESKPSWSFSGQPFTRTDTEKQRHWLTLTLQREPGMPGLLWEPSVVEERQATAVDRIEFIVGTSLRKGTVLASIGNVRIAPALLTIAALATPKTFPRDTVLVQDGQPRAVVLHPDSRAGREAAAVVVESVRKCTGVALEARPAAPVDRQPAQIVILLGNVDTNPALLQLYSRYLTPVDMVCPGVGGALVHTVFDPFGKGVNAIVAGCSDDAGLLKAAGLFAEAVDQQPQGKILKLPRLFKAQYGKAFLKRFGWAGQPPRAKRMEEGLRDAQSCLEKGAHTSLAGLLQSIASRYLLTGHSSEAKLFVAVWDLYAQSAVADPRKYGGPWGFDSDFPSSLVVAGWDVIEHDPALNDEERLRVTKTMARWLAEAVIPKCAGAARSTHVPHNHQTFPALGALVAGLYFSQGLDTIEGRTWLSLADAIFQRQAGYFKPYEDCNGYQWLTNGHLMRYAVARPDLAVFNNGNAKRIIDYCIGNMDNLGYQVPYGDTGSWQCWNSEMICLDIFSFLTNDPASIWAGAHKRRIKNTCELFAFYRSGEGDKPERFNGVQVWPLEPAYYRTFQAEGRPPLEKCVDKITFREAMDPQAGYLLLDGLSNGGHKHLDGNSLPRLTQFNRIWLADNDYFKAQVKYHNSLLVFKDGESAPIPEYCELLGAGETPRYGFCRTRLTNYAHVDWDRTVVWLKAQKAFVVLDRVVPQEKGRHQLRLLWHGIGTAELAGNGMQLTQKGPSLRLDLMPGPSLTLNNDEALGENWHGYGYAIPIVRSLSAIASVDLDARESYLFATALHGKPDGTVTPWQLRPVAGADGVLVQTDSGPFGIMLGPMQAWPSGAGLRSDASAIVTDDKGLTLLGSRSSRFGETVLHAAAQPQCIDIDGPKDDLAPARLPTREPRAMITAGTVAKPHPVIWEQRLGPPARQNLLNGRSPSVEPPAFHITRLAAARLNPGQAQPNVLVATREGTLLALKPDGTQQWAVQVGCPLNGVTAADLDRDGKDEVILARQDGHVCVLDSTGKERWKQKLEFYRRPPYVNVVRTGDLDGDGVPEIVAGAENWRFYAFKADGTPLWNYESVHPSRSGAVTDLDGDGRCEVLCGTHYYWLPVLKGNGTKLWDYSFGPICYDVTTGAFDGDKTRGVVIGGGDGYVHYLSAKGKLRMKYNTGDEVKHVLAADLDGDGKDEILAGSLSHYVYCFEADGKRRWAVDLGGPISALSAARTTDGRCLVVAATGTGRVVTLGSGGTILAASDLGKPVVDMLADSATVIVATEDGILRRLKAERAGRYSAKPAATRSRTLPLGALL
jgi:hypothetical protein